MSNELSEERAKWLLNLLRRAVNNSRVQTELGSGWVDDVSLAISNAVREIQSSHREPPPYRNVDALGRGDHNPPIGSLATAVEDAHKLLRREPGEVVEVPREHEIAAEALGRIDTILAAAGLLTIHKEGGVEAATYNTLEGVKALAADARRYRWLASRRGTYLSAWCDLGKPGESAMFNRAEMDAAIDAAISNEAADRDHG